MDNSLSESARFAVYREKLKGICEANNLSYVFIKNAYPIKLVIRPLGGVGEQMSMLEEATEDNYISPGASILFTVKDGNLTYRMSKTFTISDTLFNKIKNIFKNMHYLWLQFFFRDLVEGGKLAALGYKMPDIPESGGQQDAPRGNEPDSPNLPGEIRGIRLISPGRILLPTGFRDVRHLVAEGCQLAALNQIPEEKLEPEVVHILEDVLDFVEQGVGDRECLAHAVGQVSVLDGEQDGCARRDVVVLGRFFQHRHLLTNAAQRTDNQLDGICVLDEHIAQVVGLADALEFFTVDCETCGFRQRIIHDEAPFK